MEGPHATGLQYLRPFCREDNLEYGRFRGVEFSFTFSKTYGRTAKVLGEGWLVGDIYSMF